MDDEMRAWYQQRRREEECCRRQIAWHRYVTARESWAARNADLAALHGDVGSEFAQCDFGVVARAHRLRHRCFALREEAREKHACLHLSARHRQVVVNGPQSRALDFERWILILTRADP